MVQAGCVQSKRVNESMEVFRFGTAVGGCQEGPVISSFWRYLESQGAEPLNTWLGQTKVAGCVGAIEHSVHG